MTELKKLQAEEIVEEFLHHFKPSGKSQKLGGIGISRYNGIKIMILTKFGYSESWVHNNPYAFTYKISVNELMSIPDECFYDIYRWFMINRFKQM